MSAGEEECSRNHRQKVAYMHCYCNRSENRENLHSLSKAGLALLDNPKLQP